MLTAILLQGFMFFLVLTPLAGAIIFLFASILSDKKQKISLIGAYVCLALCFAIGSATQPIDFSTEKHLGESCETIFQFQTTYDEIIAVIRENDDDYRLFQFDAKVPEPGFIATKVNGEVKLIPYKPEPTNGQPQPATPPAASAEQ